MDTLYRDIARRTQGDIYIGVVGPVRTGKSTFIKRFMELMVLPHIEDENQRQRAFDELPVSGAGRTVMTTQPKFVPNEAALIHLRDQASFRVRLVDCGGYLVTGALGTQENETARMVRTPWFDHDIPFEQAAEIGTRRVIDEHSTLGLVVTTDGTITDLPRNAYVAAEERAVRELKALGKPFVILLNSAQPDSDAALSLQKALSEKYETPVRLMSVEKMTEEDVRGVLESMLFEFPLTEVWVETPDWVGALPEGHWLKKALREQVAQAGEHMRRVRDYGAVTEAFAQSEFFKAPSPSEIRLSEGAVSFRAQPADGLFYRVLSEESGQKVEDEEHLMTLMTELAGAKREYDRIAAAMQSVDATGFGLVPPDEAELRLEKPEMVRQGGRYGVRLRASAPSLHLLKVDIQTEVCPVVGTQEQTEELVEQMVREYQEDPDSVWNTNLLGKTLSDLIREGLAAKLSRMPSETQPKMQLALTKIVNEGSGGMICILL